MPTLRNDPRFVDIYPAALESDPDFQGLRSGTESGVTNVDVEGPIRGIRYEQSEPGGSVGRAIAYAGLAVIGLGILGLLVNLVAGSAVLMNLGSVLTGLGLLTFIIGVGADLLSREGGDGYSKM